MEKKFSEEEDEIDLLALLQEVLSHWVKVLFAAILAGALLFAYTFFMVTPQYTSTSILYVLSASTSITSLTDIQIGTNLTNDYIEVVTGRPVLDQVIENLDLDMAYAEIYAKVSLNNPDDSRLLEITVTDADPQLAKTIADEIAEVSSAFISNKMDQDPPSIIQYGYVAESPVSPNIMKNTVLGALAGAALAVALICLLYLLNDTISSPEDLEKRIGLNVLASLPKDKSTDLGDGSSGRKHKKTKNTNKNAYTNTGRGLDTGQSSGKNRKKPA